MGVSDKPAIFVFTTAYHPFVGGAEIAVEEIAKRLKDEFRFSIITARMRRSLPRIEEREEGRVIRIGFGLPWDKFLLPFWGAIQVSLLLSKAKPALFWTVMVSYAGGIPFLLNMFRLRSRTPILLTLQEGDSEAHIQKGRFGLIGLAWRLLLARADYLQTISGYLQNLAARYGYRGPVEIVPNGVDTRRFARPHPEREKARVRQALGIRPAEKIILTVSRLVPKNAVDVLIYAVRALKDRNPRLRVKLLVAGAGEERENLEALAARLGLRGEVLFLGSVPNEEVPRYLAVADVFARPSRSEGLGSAFLEAMAAGVPVIGTPVGGILDFLRDGQNGLFCRVDDPADCAEKIAALISDRGLYSRIVANAKETVAKGFQWDGIAEKFRNLFRRLSQAKKNPRLLIATGIFPPDIGGPATYSALLLEELPKQGMRVGLVTYGPAGVSRRIPKGMRHFIYFLVCLRRALSHDVVFAQDPVSAGLPALLAAKVLGRKFVIRVAGDYAWEQAVERFGLGDSIDEFQYTAYGFCTELFRKLQTFVVNRADGVVTPSRYFQKLVSRWVENPGKVHMVYNGIPLDEEPCAPRGPRGAKIIFSAGRLVPWKGFSGLVEMMKELPDWRLVIAGEGPEAESLKLQVKSLKLDDRVRLTGALPPPELRRELCKAAVFILNTSFESFSFQVVQAMQAGVPVITTNIGNLAEIIENGEEGILVEPNNQDQLIAAVRKFAEDRYFRERIVRRAREKTRAFSIEKTIARLKEVLRTL